MVTCRALRVLRISLLAGEMRSMHLSSSGALLSGAASIRLYQLVASVLTLLFTTSAIVRLNLLPLTCPSSHALCFMTVKLKTGGYMDVVATSCFASSLEQVISILQVHLVERIPFFDALYFVTTTLTTVGYGDIVAISPLGKAAVLAMILVGVVLIPVQTSQLYSQLTARRLTLGAPFARTAALDPDHDVFGRYLELLADVRGGGHSFWKPLSHSNRDSKRSHVFITIRWCSSELQYFPLQTPLLGHI